MIRLSIEIKDTSTNSVHTETRDLVDGQVLCFGRDPGPGGIILASNQVSRKHFALSAKGSDVVLMDLQSTNGTKLDGKAIQEGTVGKDQAIEASVLKISVNYEIIEGSDVGPQSRYLVNAPAPEMPIGVEGIPEAEIVDIRDVYECGRIVSEKIYCAIGAGLGSFVWIDHLRCYGAHKQDIIAIGPEPTPHGTYRRYCKNSQIPDHERLRSNSVSTPDNIWGWPGYALRESATGMAHGRIGDIRYILQVFGEPTLAESYTPRAGRVFDSIDREANRIGWSEVFQAGLVQALRKTNDGRYAVYWRAPAQEDGSQRERVTITKVAHVSTGYPATRFVDDFQDFLGRHPEKRSQVANAYEPHEHIYAHLEASNDPFNIVVRGRGIVASRILQRLSEARHKNSNITILHSIRSPIRAQEGAKFGWARRPVRDHVELQPFNWPKAAWGGDLRKTYENASSKERGAILSQLGGTTTAERSDWLAIAERGAEEGWYKPLFGNVQTIDHNGDRLSIEIQSNDGFSQTYEADYLVDCTGLIADLDRSAFLADLRMKYRLEQNHAFKNVGKDWEQGRATGLRVSNSFEIEGLRNHAGRVYAAGQVTQGGPYLAVDSFLGLQYAALRAVDHMTSDRVTRLRPIGPAKSFGQWIKWCTGAAP